MTGVACHGLADAIDRGDLAAVDEAIARAAEQTPDGIEAIVLGCTHYPLVLDSIVAALPAGTRLFDSAEAVAGQTLRRIDAQGRPTAGSGTVTVYSSGRAGELPTGAATYESGRILGAVDTACHPA